MKRYRRVNHVSLLIISFFIINASSLFALNGFTYPSADTTLRDMVQSSTCALVNPYQRYHKGTGQVLTDKQAEKYSHDQLIEQNRVLGIVTWIGEDKGSVLSVHPDVVTDDEGNILSNKELMEWKIRCGTTVTKMQQNTLDTWDEFWFEEKTKVILHDDYVPRKERRENKEAGNRSINIAIIKLPYSFTPAANNNETDFIKYPIPVTFSEEMVGVGSWPIVWGYGSELEEPPAPSIVLKDVQRDRVQGFLKWFPMEYIGHFTEGKQMHLKPATQEDLKKILYSDRVSPRQPQYIPGPCNWGDKGAPLLQETHSRIVPSLIDEGRSPLVKQFVMIGTHRISDQTCLLPNEDAPQPPRSSFEDWRNPKVQQFLQQHISELSRPAPKGVIKPTIHKPQVK